ncbi:MAG: HdeD family acid-resistance protein [Pseudomonadota bacterium]|nr:HdeD family acid-resistance protein [Pseudomonadota bacterium]
MTETENKTAAETMGPELERLFGELGKNWGWILALGILFIILGTIGLGITFALTLTTVMFFGALLAVGGVLQIIDAFKCKGWKGVVLHVLIGLLYIAAALMLFTMPLAGSLVLTVMLGGAIAAVGILRIIMGFQMKGKKGWGWLVFAGLVSLLLGGIILFEWPATGLWVIGLLVAIELIIHGWSYVFMALAARRAVKEPAPAS